MQTFQAVDYTHADRRFAKLLRDSVNFACQLLHRRPEVVLSARYTAQSYRDERLKEFRESAN